MQKKIQKIFFDFEIIAFELVALNNRFYWERILVIGYQYVSKQSQDYEMLLKIKFWSWFSFRVIKKIDKKTAVLIKAVFWTL